MHHRLSGRVATDIVFSNALLAISLWVVKEWLLSQNIGAFWVLMRVLACGAFGLGLREVASGNAPKALVTASSAKVRNFFFPFVFIRVASDRQLKIVPILPGTDQLRTTARRKMAPGVPRREPLWALPTFDGLPIPPHSRRRQPTARALPSHVPDDRQGLHRHTYVRPS